MEHDDRRLFDSHWLFVHDDLALLFGFLLCFQFLRLLLGDRLDMDRLDMTGGRAKPRSRALDALRAFRSLVRSLVVQ